MFDEEIKIVKINNVEVVRIINKLQVVHYLKCGCNPIAVELGYNDKLVFVFNKEDTIRTQCWESWKKHTIERKLEKLNLYNVGACDLEDYDYFFNE